MDSLVTNSHFTSVLIRVFLSLCVVLVFFAPPATPLQSIRNSTHSRGYQWQPASPLSWNITGTYEGSWGLLDSKIAILGPGIRKSSGDSVLEFISTPTNINGVHYVKVLGGILITYEFPKFLPVILLLMHSYWIPQIVTNVFRDPRKPLHPCYIIGMSVNRLAILIHIFGCPRNFLHIKPDRNWCIYLVGFAGLQAKILLLLHCLGCRCFILWQPLISLNFQMFAWYFWTAIQLS